MVAPHAVPVVRRGVAPASHDAACAALIRPTDSTIGTDSHTTHCARHAVDPSKRNHTTETLIDLQDGLLRTY